LWENTSNNLYRDLHDGFSDLNIRNYEYALGGESGDIKEQLNKYLEIHMGQACIGKSISSNELKEIADGNVWVLSLKIDRSCKDENGIIPNNILTDIIQYTYVFHQKASIDAEKLSDTLYNISRTGIFADGDTNNSWFDIIADLQDIDAIIFSEEIDYNGEANRSPTSSASAYDGFNLAWPSRWIGRVEFINGTPTYTPESGSNNAQNDRTPQNQNTQAYVPELEYICEPTQTTNFLNSNQSAALLVDIEAELAQNSVWNINNQDEIIPESPIEDSIDPIQSDNFPPYQAASNTWPCSWFFCIEVDFVSYNHKLLWWWDDTSSIEYLVARSNKHLKPFVYSSLTPAKMTTNNFELSLENLDLGENFSMPFVLIKKPVPILRKVSQAHSSDEKEDSFDGTNLMIKYYESLWLEYHQKNSISNYLWTDYEQATLYNSSEENINEFAEKYSQYLAKTKKQKEQFDHISNSVQKHVWQNDLEVFLDSFQETETFLWWAIHNYVERLDFLIRALNQIPIQWK